MSNEPVVFDAKIDVQVFQDDNYCSVTLFGPEWETSGHARRNPDDVVDRETGFVLALGRALENAGRKLTKRGNGLVKHADDVKLAKYISELRNQPLPTWEDLVRFLEELGLEDEPAPYVHGGFSPGPDFSDPSDPWLQPLGGLSGAIDDDGETLFVTVHSAERD